MAIISNVADPKRKSVEIIESNILSLLLMTLLLLVARLALLLACSNATVPAYVYSRLPQMPLQASTQH